MVKKVYRVYIDPGHGGSDPGAVKYLVERDVNLVMALACRDFLEQNGVLVKMSRTTNGAKPTINEMAREANNWDADYVVSIHNNAGKGDGFEIYYGIGSDMSGSKGLAKNIEAEVKAIGQNSRGLKTKVNSEGKDYFGMIRLTNMPAVICEGVFVDNATDVKIADTTAEQKAFGVAYAKGILKTLGIDYSKKTTSSSGSSKTTTKKNEGYLVKVTATALNIRSGAGTNYDVNGVIRDKGVYTIVETKKNWGKLKSGAGWICLDYTLSEDKW